MKGIPSALYNLGVRGYEFGLLQVDSSVISRAIGAQSAKVAQSGARKDGPFTKRHGHSGTAN